MGRKLLRLLATIGLGVGLMGHGLLAEAEPLAFTHAMNNKTGLWEVAIGGTLFLDQLGDLAPQHQAKILRTLQEGTLRRVGGTTEVHVKDVRVLAATNKELYSLVKTGQFREDLYYRLRGFLIRTPALKEHPEDIPLIARHVWTSITGGTRSPLPGEYSPSSLRPMPGRAT